MPMSEVRDRKGRTYHPKVGEPRLPTGPDTDTAANGEPIGVTFGRAILDASAERVGPCGLGSCCSIEKGIFYQPGMCDIDGCPRKLLPWSEHSSE